MFHLRVLGAQAGNALGGIIWGNSIPIRRAAKDLRATRTAGAAIRALCDQRVVKCQANIPYPSRYLVHSRGMENAARGKQNIADPDFTSPTLDVDPFKKSVKMGRPLSPHFTIYQPQITWIGSILHRITGSGIAAAVYTVSCLYVVYPFTPEGLLNFLSYIPHPVISFLKAAVTASFFYHFFNGIRHLVWDTTKMLKSNEVSNTGWIVVGLTLLTTGLIMAIK